MGTQCLVDPTQLNTMLQRVRIRRTGTGDGDHCGNDIRIPNSTGFLLMFSPIHHLLRWIPSRISQADLPSPSTDRHCGGTRDSPTARCEFR